MEGFKPAGIHMGVYLGGGDVGMAEHHLDGTKIRTAGKEMGGKGMAQYMGADLFVDARRESDFADDLPETVPRHCRAAVGAKKQGASLIFEKEGTDVLQVFTKNLIGGC